MTGEAVGCVCKPDAVREGRPSVGWCPLGEFDAVHLVASIWCAESRVREHGERPIGMVPWKHDFLGSG